jgi:dienelactone hydrolase
MAALAMVALVAGPVGAPGLVGPATVEAQQGNPYERGPDPTAAALEANEGPFDVSQVGVTGQSGFGGGTIYYPNDTSQGTFGAIAVSPGFLTPGSLMGWAGPRIASHGFVVLIMNTNTTTDFPDSRAQQLQAALDYMVDDATVGPRIDGTRLGLMGHSMGGGGSLIAAADNPDLQAAVPLQPWNGATDFSNLQVPTMIIGAQNDTTASVTSHAEPFYESIPEESEKAYLELAGQGHTVGVSGNTTQAKYAVAWFKRYIDNDARYEQFLCPAPQESSISEYRDTCPGPGSEDPGTDPGPDPDPDPDPEGGQCFTEANSAHRDAGRAEGFLVLTAVGSGDSLGLWLATTSLRETSPGTWEMVDSC